MSVVLDEQTDTVVLGGLDFRERCMANAVAEHEADVATRFRCCGAGALLCEKHAKNQRESVDALLARGQRLICGYCATEFTSYDGGVEVMPL